MHRRAARATPPSAPSRATSPAKQSDTDPPPAADLRCYKPAGKLTGKRDIVAGGDSGIGRSVALAFALEGPDVAVVYNENDDDAAQSKRLIADRAPARTCLTVKADVRSRTECFAVVDHVADKLGGLDVLVNNAAFQKADDKFEDATEADIRRPVIRTSSATCSWPRRPCGP